MSSLEMELQVTREELELALRELEYKENAPIEGRVADEDRYMVSLLRLQSRVRALKEEEHRLVMALDQGEESWKDPTSSEVSA